MGLRGAAIFVPLCGACFLKGKVPKGAAYAAVIMGPVMTLAGRLILPAGISGDSGSIAYLCGGCVCREKEAGIENV